MVGDSSHDSSAHAKKKHGEEVQVPNLSRDARKTRVGLYKWNPWNQVYLIYYERARLVGQKRLHFWR